MSTPLRTYVFSHNGPIQAGAEKLGICGSVSGRLGTLGRGTLARLFVNDLSAVRPIDGRTGTFLKNKRQREREEIVTVTVVYNVCAHTNKHTE